MVEFQPHLENMFVKIGIFEVKIQKYVCGATTQTVSKPSTFSIVCLLHLCQFWEVYLVGGFSLPIWNICSSIVRSFPQILGNKNSGGKKNTHLCKSPRNSLEVSKSDVGDLSPIFHNLRRCTWICLEMVVGKNKHIPQMVLKKGWIYHGRIRKKSPTKQTKVY